MTSLERKLIVHFLGIAADKFSNHCCNDFEPKEANLTKEEIMELRAGLKEDGFYGDDEVPEKYFLDWMLMRWVSKRVEKH
jgi:hypothetical protein